MTPRGRLQFSLGALVMTAVCAGLVGTVIFEKSRHDKARAELDALREKEHGLIVTDPTKIYAREAPVDFEHCWRFRVYLPQAGDYQCCIQTQRDVPRPTKGNFGFDIKAPGEYYVCVRVVPLKNGSFNYEITMPEHSFSMIAKSTLDYDFATKWIFLPNTTIHNPVSESRTSVYEPRERVTLLAVDKYVNSTPPILAVDKQCFYIAIEKTN